ncbi:MAG: cupin domain-containing protein [Opitutales bacterium]
MNAQIRVTPAASTRADPTPWGGLRWYADAANENSDALTVGRCTLLPACANPRHRHPNCEEVLVVLEGEIEHTAADETTCRMGPGDVVTIPPGVWHNALNVGASKAELLIVFSSAHRQTELMDTDTVAEG